MATFSKPAKPKLHKMRRPCFHLAFEYHLGRTPNVSWHVSSLVVRLTAIKTTTAQLIQSHLECVPSWMPQCSAALPCAILRITFLPPNFTLTRENFALHKSSGRYLRDQTSRWNYCKTRRRRSRRRRSYIQRQVTRGKSASSKWVIRYERRSGIVDRRSGSTRAPRPHASERCAHRSHPAKKKKKKSSLKNPPGFCAPWKHPNTGRRLWHQQQNNSLSRGGNKKKERRGRETERGGDGSEMVMRSEDHRSFGLLPPLTGRGRESARGRERRREEDRRGAGVRRGRGRPERERERERYVGNMFSPLPFHSPQL